MLQGLYKFKDLKYFTHISFVTSDQLWISDRNGERKKFLIDFKTGDILHRETNSIRSFDEIGCHTVNNKQELIYIDSDIDISKLSEDRKACTKCIKITDAKWKASCVNSSISTGELLVGMKIRNLSRGKVCQYNISGQLIQTLSFVNDPFSPITEAYQREPKWGSRFFFRLCCYI